MRVMEKELPEPILQRIFSLLDFKDLIRSSAVSKAWKDAVSGVQHLTVTGDNLLPYERYSGKEDIAFLPGEIKEKVESMLTAVETFIKKAEEQQSSPQIKKFSFQFDDGFWEGWDFSPYLDRFVTALGLGSKANKVKELEFQVCLLHCYNRYKFPESVYVAPFLNKLHLEGFNNLSASTGAKINLSSLKELHLSSSLVDQELLELLIASCSQLEILNLDGCAGFRSLEILGLHHKLKKIITICPLMHRSPTNFANIVIKEAPNLEYLTHSGSLKILSVLDVVGCKNLKFLKLESVRGDGKLIEQVLSNVNNLEELLMDGFVWTNHQGIRSIRISSNSLRVLWLGFSVTQPGSILEAQVDISVDAPHLWKFIYSGTVLSTLSLLETSSLKEISLHLSSVDSLYFGVYRSRAAAKYSEAELQSQYRGALVEFIASLNHPKAAIELKNFVHDKLVIPKHERDDLRPPLTDIKHLTVASQYFRFPASNLDMLDSLLWIAPRLDTLSFVGERGIARLFVGEPGKTIFQFLYEDSGDNEISSSSSCKSNRVEFWREGLRRIKIENLEDDAQGQQLKNYFFENAKFLESIDMECGLSV